jgi:hypothetical protein
VKKTASALNRIDGININIESMPTAPSNPPRSTAALFSNGGEVALSEASKCDCGQDVRNEWLMDMSMRMTATSLRIDCATAS